MRHLLLRHPGTSAIGLDVRMALPTSVMVLLLVALCLVALPVSTRTVEPEKVVPEAAPGDPLCLIIHQRKIEYKFRGKSANSDTSSHGLWDPEP